MLKSWLAGSLFCLAAAQFPPPMKGVKTLKSKFHENVTITYKEPHLCELTEGVKSYAGHVHLPPGFLDDVNGETQEYPVNTFFWFFESRHDPENAPLAIWLNGGPGGSSMMGLLQENGPCFIEDDSQTEIHNPWSWNNYVNMLYIDEPNQVGLSYDTPTNVTIKVNATDGSVAVDPTDFEKEGLPAMDDWTHRASTLSTQSGKNTVNTTAQAGHALWHFAQTWFFEFPHYKPNEDRVSLWTESYGGHYGPGFMRFFQQQNEKIANGTIEVDHAHYIHLDTLGIINGYLDSVVQEESFISFPYNNTYGIQLWNESFYNDMMTNWTVAGGCKDQMQACRANLTSWIHDSVSTLEDFPETGLATFCPGLDSWCQSLSQDEYLTRSHAENGRGAYDITHSTNDPFPPPNMIGYMTQASVLESLGTPVNFTATSEGVAKAFTATFDLWYGGFLDAVGYLLDSGIKVHLVYGDKDFVCNWVGGQAASLAVPYSGAEAFASAGYVPLLTKEHGWDGMTRQYGNFSFSRVFQAGHEVPAYQPEAAYEIFMRAMFNKDIATGLLPVFDEFRTVGVGHTWDIKNEVLDNPEPACYVLSPDRCLPEVWERVANGTAKTKNYYVVQDDEDEGEEGKHWYDTFWGEL